MSNYIQVGNLRVAKVLHDFVNSKVLPDTGVEQEQFWGGFDDLIHDLQKDKFHIAMVSGEYGEVVGLVTMEDALEELVGEIYDEHDESIEEILMSKFR